MAEKHGWEIEEGWWPEFDRPCTHDCDGFCQDPQGEE